MVAQLGRGHNQVIDALRLEVSFYRGCFEQLQVQEHGVILNMMEISLNYS